MTKSTGRGRGFASLTPEQHRKIASMGGRALWAKGKPHKFTPETAREAGRKGGLKAAARRREREAEA